MELKQYLSIVRRWSWLLILGLILGASGGFFGSNYQTPVYQASYAPAGDARSSGEDLRLYLPQ